MRRPAAALLLLLAGAPAPARAEAPPAARHRAILVLRIVAYDRNLGRRGGGDLVVAIVHRPGDPAAEAERDELLEAFAAVGRAFVAAGRPVTARAVPFHGAEDLAARLDRVGATASYVCAGLEDGAAEIARATRRARVLSLGGSRALAEAGLAIALVTAGKQSRVVVNLAAARAEGADLDAALLSLAELVGQGTRR